MGNCIYDLKVKGDSIKSVELKILSEIEYSLPFDVGERTVYYSYSVIICNDDMIRKIVCNSWTFDNISYEHGFVKIK